MQDVHDKILKENFGYWTRNLFITDDYSPMGARFIATLGLILSAFMLYLAYFSDNEFPAYDELKFQTGLVAEIKTSKHYITIKLDNSDYRFIYHSKSGLHTYVGRKLSNTGQVILGFTPSLPKKGARVYDIQLNGETLRSYTEVKNAYAKNNEIGKWLGPIFVILSLYLFSVAHFTKKAQHIIERQHS